MNKKFFLFFFSNFFTIRFSKESFRFDFLLFVRKSQITRTRDRSKNEKNRIHTIENVKKNELNRIEKKEAFIISTSRVFS